MKKLFLFLSLICALGLVAQNINNNKFSSPGNLYKQYQKHQITNPSEVTPSPTEHKIPTKPKGTDVVFPIAIGESGNAWGFSYMRTTFLWAVNDINTISFIHRMMGDPGTGYLAYDVSKDGGETWTLNNQVYEAGENARYPQGLIYNPAGNTDPDNAYFSYFAPTLDESNATGNGSNWGGYAWGSKKFAEGALPTQTNLPSDNGFFHYLPSGFTITQLGEAWVVDEENDGSSGEYTYTGNLIVGHGLWNDEIEDFEYEFEHMELELNPDNGINDVKVAFAPDGMTGWICALSDRIPALDQTWFHPILFKTTNGGEDWSDPIEVQLGGEDGLDAVKEFISDEALIDFYSPEPVPPRDEIPYYMGYHMDMAVDAWGNPHILGVVAICDLEELSWYHYDGVFAMFHIYSDDQGETWQAFNIDYLQTFSYEYSGGGSTMNQYNRPQVATTEDGAIVFFSFLDTRIEEVTENSDPDIFFREYIPEMQIHGEEVINVTYFSNAMWNARWGCMSHYVFADVTENGNYECTIPFVYEELSGNDISAPVQFWYIPDFTRSYVITRTDENMEMPKVTVSQNFPSPFKNETHFNINLLEKSEVEVSVFNATGQLVKTFDFGSLGNGPQQITLKFQDLKEGLYFYSLTAGGKSIKGKMLAN